MTQQTGGGGVPSPRLRPGSDHALVLALGAIVLFGAFLALEPLLQFSAWGSDSGEYATLTAHLLLTGHFYLQGYNGWGFGYPYFPGTFEVGGAVAASTGTDPLLSLEIALPALAALSGLPIFLLCRRLYPSDTVALLAAGLCEVVFPRVFILSHAAPATLGDLLVVAALWFLVEQRRDPRALVPLALSGGALILTHHLSSYFFLLSALGLLVGLELYAPRAWSRRFPLREVLFLEAFVGTLVAYWYFYAPPFQAILSEGLLGAPAWLAFPAGLGLVALAALLMLLRRQRPFVSWGRLWKVRWPTWDRMARDATFITLLLVGGLLYLLFFPLPGTGDVIPFSDLVYFLPFLLLVPLAAAGGRGMATLSRLGTGSVGWFAIIAVSAGFALKTANQAIPPDRHPEYLALPLILLAAMLLGRGLAAVRTSTESPWASVGAWVAVGALLGANAAVAYPPPTLIEGFQEGFSSADMALASWSARELPAGATFASDHRLSDLYFLFSGGANATWSAAPCLFQGNNSSCAISELRSLSFPQSEDPARSLDAVGVDQVMVQQGVALNPNNPAYPMSPWAWQFLHGPGFVELYANGDQVVWWVDEPGLSASS